MATTAVKKTKTTETATESVTASVTEPDRKSTRLNSSHKTESRMPSSA